MNSGQRLLGKFNKFPKPITSPDRVGAAHGNVWPRQKSHAKLSIACIETRLPPHSASSPNMLPVGIN
ncbi:MAG: hypothetical protein KJ606_08645 [Chloroflexi bacterium]|nr:hypothetical protein [Chloroflexota bacterium]